MSPGTQRRQDSWLLAVMMETLPSGGLKRKTERLSLNTHLLQVTLETVDTARAGAHLAVEGLVAV